MSRDYPDWLNPFKAAQARREFAGTMRLSELRPVLDLINDPGDAEIEFELGFDLDDQREVRVNVRVCGEVPMICQRSLRPFHYAVDSESIVAIVDSEAAAARLPEDYEPLVIAEPKLRIADLVAEELLLALPLVPRAPDSEPVGAREATDAQDADTHRPFAVLADLARKRD
ncbi:MAG: YceD family protein [Wenzhouxiangella sp.]